MGVRIRRLRRRRCRPLFAGTRRADLTCGLSPSPRVEPTLRYPVFDDIAQAKGTKGVVVFLGICASLIYVFGLVGCMVAASSSIN